MRAGQRPGKTPGIGDSRSRKIPNAHSTLTKRKQNNGKFIYFKSSGRTNISRPSLKKLPVRVPLSSEIINLLASCVYALNDCLLTFEIL